MFRPPESMADKSMENKSFEQFIEIPENDMMFIPEVQIDENTGKAKPKPFKQKEYVPPTEYGG